jgi:phosphoribosyl-AMP cyclohydrolase
MNGCDLLDFSKMDGVKEGVIGVIQDFETGEVLAAHWMDRVEVRSLEQGIVLYPHLTNQDGGRQKLQETYADCDADTLLLQVEVHTEMSETIARGWLDITDPVTLSADLKCDQVQKSIAIAQHWETNEVLMVGVATVEAIKRTLTTGNATFWSRSKCRLWTKGETSGNILELAEAQMDKTGAVVVYHVKPFGHVCHTGAQTCFREQDGSMRVFN